MKNPFKIPQSNKVCHKILGYLLTKSNGINLYYPATSIEIAIQIGVKLDIINLLHTSLALNNEIICDYHDDKIVITLTDTGKSNYINEKFLKDGRKERLTGFALVAQNIAPWLGLIISGIALYKSFNK